MRGQGRYDRCACPVPVPCVLGRLAPRRRRKHSASPKPGPPMAAGSGPAPTGGPDCLVGQLQAGIQHNQSPCHQVWEQLLLLKCPAQLRAEQAGESKYVLELTQTNCTIISLELL